ncbi:MAG: hypothetical protein ACE5DK_08900 [Paracoccaceae bacterium]
MSGWLKRFTRDELGMVTIDWIAVSGFTIALALSVINLLGPTAEQQGADIVSRASISTQF